MDDERPLFILAGNGPYDNRGCEAIVRGTTKILREYFKDPRFVCISHYQNEKQFQEQSLQETDPDITHLHSQLMTKKKAIKNFWSPKTWSYVSNYLFNGGSRGSLIYQDMLPYLNEASAVLSIGGDNYSLDYGIPKLLTNLDDVVLQRGKPLVIWGASIGPFNTMPNYEKYMSQHLQKAHAILARESVTVDYLKSIGLSKNVFSVADPAFVVDPEKPKGIDDIISIGEESIGLNFSPLMAKYVTGGDNEAWINIVARVIESVSEKTELPIFLIPHVTSPNSNDYECMQKAFSLLKNRKFPITLIPPLYSATESKWIISQMTLFAGARTHATIAALSSGVPTMSFSYSIKSQGINCDIFGHSEYCMDPIDLSDKAVADQVLSMLDEKAMIINELREHIPQVQKDAISAGIKLKNLI